MQDLSSVNDFYHTMCQVRTYIVPIVIIFASVNCLDVEPSFHQDYSPIVTTTTGVVRGNFLKIDNKYPVVSFLGIPFAEPPIKNNRFKKPVPVKPWEGVLDATKKPSACMQIQTKEYDWVDTGTQNEDCLYLNLWIPNKLCNIGTSNGASLYLPVMIWLHGGGFWSGSSSIELYDGATLAAYGNVIVASLNYRLGSFGFLYSGTSEAPGNMGLHDQTLAIEWIKNNAQNFCGDPSRITLFGNSAGSVSIGLHVVSPLSQNLFSRAIMQSASPFHPLFDLDPNIVKLKDSQFAASLGCANETINMVTDPKTVVDCLRNSKAEDLVLSESVILERVPYFFLPTYGDDFLPKSPVEIIKSNGIKNKEILLGSNKDEGTIFLNYVAPEVFNVQTPTNLTVDVARNVIETMFQRSSKPTPKEIADFYLNNLKDEDSEKILEAVGNSFGDFTFVCPVVLFAEKAADQNDVFYYLFTHRSSKSNWGNWIGVAHSDEVPFVFGEPLKPNSGYTGEECKFSYETMQKWTCFARNGKPEKASDEKWPKYSSSHEYYVLSPNSQEIGENLHKEACNFWKRYF